MPPPSEPSRKKRRGPRVAPLLPRRLCTTNSGRPLTRGRGGAGRPRARPRAVWAGVGLSPTRPASPDMIWLTRTHQHADGTGGTCPWEGGDRCAPARPPCTCQPTPSRRRTECPRRLGAGAPDSTGNVTRPAREKRAAVRCHPQKHEIVDEQDAARARRGPVISPPREPGGGPGCGGRPPRLLPGRSHCLVGSIQISCQPGANILLATERRPSVEVASVLQPWQR